MAIRTSKGTAISPIRTLFHLGAVGSMTDGQLLDRFANGRGASAELAFAALVERHGSMVLGVCRAVLRDEHDAQDAFQATFLVLVRKARSLWVRDSMAPWLHAVALRAARSARSARRRRSSHEWQRALLAADRPDAEVDPDRERLLHREIDRLPERYRLPVVLCDLEGQTHEQASRYLGCPVGTVKSRLARGRARLRERLTRLGLAANPAAIPRFGIGEGLSAVPASLIRDTISLAGRSAAGAVPTAVAVLARKVLLAMSFVKLAILAAPVLLASLAIGAEGLARADRSDDSGPSAMRSLPRDDPDRAGALGVDVPIHEVKVGVLMPTVTLRGTLEASRIEEVSNPIEGTVTIVSIVPEGTVVEQGQTVCVLDSSQLRQSLADQQIATDRALADSRNAVKAREVAEINVQEYIKGVYPREEKAIEGEIKRVQAELSRAEDRLGWSDDMRKLGYVSKAQNLSDRYDAQRAEFNLTQAKKRLEVLRKYTKQKTIKSLEGDIEKARVEELDKKSIYEREQENEETLRRSIAMCTLSATGPGIVVDPQEEQRLGVGDGPSIGEGSSVREGQVILGISGPMLVDVEVPDSMIERIAPGQMAGVWIDAFPGEVLPGTVDVVRPPPDRAGDLELKTHNVMIQLDEARLKLLPGMTATATIFVADPRKAMAVPTRALLRHDGTDYVAVKNPDGTFDWRAVKLGIRRDGLVEVTDGLRAGEVVAVEPLGLKISGSPRDLDDRVDNP